MEIYFSTLDICRGDFFACILHVMQAAFVRVCRLDTSKRETTVEHKANCSKSSASELEWSDIMGFA